MKLEFTTLDVFTITRFRGNPLAIVRVPAAYRAQFSEEQKQKIAAEFNLGETVFLHEASQDDEIVDYDIFTVRARVSFAGHPTIGTALYIMEHARAAYPSVTALRTVAGRVPLTYAPTTHTASVAVPHDVHVHAKQLDDAPIVSIVKGMAFALTPLADTDALGAVPGGLIPVAEVYQGAHLDPHDGWNAGFTGTFYYVDMGEDPEDAGGRPRRLLRTRMFGSREDSGTGSASSALGAYLALQEPRALGRGPFAFHLVQGVEMGRRCDIYVDVLRTEDGAAVAEVRLEGNAVAVMQGSLEIDVQLLGSNES